MSSRIRIKMGGLEVEYEGEEDYLRNGLLDFLESFAGIVEGSEFPELGGEGNGEDEGSRSPAARIGDTPALAPGTIAARLKAETGTDLVLAAAAYLKFTKGSNSFTRQEILSTMKEATGYYKKSMSNNLSRYLDSLVKNNQLHGLTNNKYSLSASTENDLKARIAV